ncbi:hypothetical protein NQ315_012338 [Exocentrus adspersus]|uniref:Anillin homology domain-containing protein n=1 Tax=Exocentrus adspersus TaxID=1586481 RepID=A0AAV8V8Y2_9CUCU|nr:hypothetical protein NQ315_012338 [Exocentrus adspersus]
MDAFTEKILARARERQRMLEGYPAGDKAPLRENNADLKATSEPNLRNVKETVNPKEAVSDSALNKVSSACDTTKENKPETSVNKFTRQNSTTRVSSELPGSPQPLSKTLNIQRDNFNMEIKLTSADNVRVEVEIEDQSDHSDAGSSLSEGSLRDESKSKLKRLGRLYAGGEDADISSPIHRTEGRFHEREDKEASVAANDPAKKTPASKCGSGLSKLADLAKTINEWEDDMHPNPSVEMKQASTPRRAWKAPAPQPPTTGASKTSPLKPSQKSKAPDPPTPTKGVLNKNVTAAKEKVATSPRKSITEQKLEKEELPKQLKWDQNVLESLVSYCAGKNSCVTLNCHCYLQESQGFTRTTSSTRLIYSYDSSEQCPSTQVKTAQTSYIAKTVEEAKPDAIPEEEECNDEKTPSRTKFVKEKASPCPKSPSKTQRTPQIATKAAMFESSPTKTKDPALLSVSERKALFEKNRGAALVPKAPIGLSAPVKVETTMKASCTKIITDENIKPSSILNKQKEAGKKQSPSKKTPVQKPAQVVEMVEKSPSKIGKYTAPRPPPVAATEQRKSIAAIQAGGIASKMAALLENKSTISQEQIEHSIKEQRQKEMDMLLNRFQRNKATRDAIEEVAEDDSEDEIDATEETAMIQKDSTAIVTQTAKPGEKRKSGGKPYSKGDSPVVTSVLEDVKRIKVSPPKAGRLYPNLSDIEATTETETENNTRSPSPDKNSSFEDSRDSDDPNTSFGREILQAVCSNQTPQKRPIFDESTASDVSSILDDMDNYLGEISDEDNSAGPTPPNTVDASTLFNYKNYSPNVNTPKTRFQSPVKIITSPKRNIDVPTHVVEGDSVLPLTHTVSFYRKQQSQVQTPVRQLTRQPLIEESPEETPTDDKTVEKKLRELQDEVNKQQNIISQTSQALNLCNSTLEFSGSTEQVEAERVLLVATHRRQAALHELQRLKIEKTLRPQGLHAQNIPLEKGSLTISNIVLPLKQKYVKALAAAGGKGHHVVCLAKCLEQVVPTKLVSTIITNAKNPDADLYIPGSITLDNIYSDFTVTFEVYLLQAQEEYLPHEIKYHINSKKSNKL